MDVMAWPARDQPWLARYRRAMVGTHVPASALEERERELLRAVHVAGVPADELFGDAAELAAEDAAELSTADEAVRTSEGAGLRPAVREVGGTLLGMGAVAALGTWTRSGSSVDVGVASTLVAAGVATAFLGWVVGRALLSAGRTAPAVGVLLGAVAVAVAAVAAAAQVGAGPVVARDVPVPLLCLGLLTPGALVLVAAGRLPQPVLRQRWDDDEWLRRLSGGLRNRLVPSVTARGHRDEVRQAIRVRGVPACEEFGHPLVLARQLADADRTARARRWWAGVLSGTAAPLAVAVLLRANDSYGALTTPLAVAMALVAVITLSVRWSSRPWRERR